VLAGEWGPEGIVVRMMHCQRNDIASAGTGRDLEEAREPA
jgi:hypothetical protein